MITNFEQTHLHQVVQAHLQLGRDFSYDNNDVYGRGYDSCDTALALGYVEKVAYLTYNSSS